MPLINKITIKNFRSFREKTSSDLADGSYFIGINNSGKSTILNAVHFFFNDAFFGDESFINKTSFLSKKAGSNTAEITINFDLNALNTKKLKQNLINEYGDNLSISKFVSVTTDTKIMTHYYKLNSGTSISFLPEEVFKLVKSVKVTYLHPQEGQILLTKAQEKLRQRLLANWGRGANITQSITTLQEEWDKLRNKSKTYLSGALTENLQKMWPDSEVTINLPKSIRDIITISDINFLGYKNAPEIELTSQGTGAQTTILYLTHFILDSDRSLHRGEYHPLWLLEEPESFLHVDLLANLARQLNSEKWLSNIQMIISTHSPVLLAGSRIAGGKVIWSVLSDRGVIQNKATTKYNDDEVKEIGKLMGDPNFFAYFLAAQNEQIIFTEDKKHITIESYKKTGINITKGLNGTSEISKFIDVFVSMPSVINNKIFFIIDSDKGKSEFSRFYEPELIDKSKGVFTRFKVKNSENVYLIFLPDDCAVESLFSEFDNHIDECISKLWDINTWSLNILTPPNLSGVVSCIRRSIVNSKEEAIALIKNHEDVKSLFWDKVKKFHYNMNQEQVTDLKHLLL